MKLKAVHHIAIIVSDYEKSKDFYVNKLGFEIIRENHRPERHDYKLVYGAVILSLKYLEIVLMIQNMKPLLRE